MKQVRLCALVLAALVASQPAASIAATKTFANSGSALSWLNAGNWSPSGVPTSTDDVLINGGTGEMRMTAGDVTIQYLTYSSATDSRQLTINTTTATSRTLTLDGSGANPLINHNGGSGTTFSIHTNSSTGAAALTVQLNASGQFNVQNLGAILSISSAITETGGARSIEKTGAGTLILSGANTYAGGTTLSAGILQLGSEDVISNTGTFTFNGGTLDVNNQNEAFGALSLTADSTLDMGTPGTVTTITFASASSLVGVKLTIDNWDEDVGGETDHILIGSGIGDVDANILANIQFTGHSLGATLNGNELLPFALVPEPTSLGLPAFGLMFAGWRIVRWSRNRRQRNQEAH